MITHWTRTMLEGRFWMKTLLTTLGFVSFLPRSICTFACSVAEEITRTNCCSVMDVMTATTLSAWFLLYLMYPRGTGGVPSVLLRYSSITNWAFHVFLVRSEEQFNLMLFLLGRRHSSVWNGVKMSCESPATPGWWATRRKKCSFQSFHRLALLHNIVTAKTLAFVCWELKLDLISCWGKKWGWAVGLWKVIQRGGEAFCELKWSKWSMWAQQEALLGGNSLWRCWDQLVAESGRNNLENCSWFIFGLDWKEVLRLWRWKLA